MDISVAHLNNRLALQLPTQLPLGLVFVQGTVRNLTRPEVPLVRGRTTFPLWFNLIEGGYSIRCFLSARAVEETLLQDGDRIRAGGHLIFDVQQAHYQLLARDVEIVADELATGLMDQDNRAVPSALVKYLADVKKRADAAQMMQKTDAAEESRLVREELPGWVKRLAPPEVQAEKGKVGGESIKTTEQRDSALDNEVLRFLSAAMEGVHDVELTPDLLGEVAAERATEVVTNLDEKGDEKETAVSLTNPAQPPTTPPAPISPSSQSEAVDWTIIFLVLSGIMLFAALLLIFLAYAGR